MNRAKNFLIGFIVILAIVLAIYGYSFLSGKDYFGTYFGEKNIYYVKYNHINGLSSSSYVTLRGFNIGKVIDIYFSDEMAKTLIVSFTIDKKYKIPKNSIARIVSMDLMGTRAINIIPPSILATSGNYIQPGDTLNGNVEGNLKEQVSEQVRPLRLKTENLLSSIDSMVNIINLVLNKKNQEHLVNSIYNIRQTMQHLTVASRNLENLIIQEHEKLKNIIENTYQTTTTIRNNNENLNNIFSNFSQLSNTLAETDFTNTIIKTKNTLDETSKLLQAINQGKGSLGAFIHDEELYQNMNNTSRNLDRLLLDFQRNPKKYINLSIIDLSKKKYYDEHGNQISKKRKKRNTWYTIQILYVTKPIKLTDRFFKGRRDIKVFRVNNTNYRYTIGYSNSYRKIYKQLKQIKRDFPEAFIVSVNPTDVIYN